MVNKPSVDVLNDKYMVVDEKGIIYPLKEKLHKSQFMTFVSAQNYAEHLASVHIGDRYEVHGLRRITSFIQPKTLVQRTVWANKTQGWVKP